MSIRRVTVGVDGSPASRTAVAVVPAQRREVPLDDAAGRIPASTVSS